MKVFVQSPILFDAILEKIKSSISDNIEPVSFLLIERFGRDPYIILISCILSLRTRDKVTLDASMSLFRRVKDPQGMLKIPLDDLKQLIYPVGFYHRKAQQIQKINKILIENYQGSVPSSKQELLNLPGVGIKTANLVLSLGFKIPALCVDIHVHRIANRLGLVHTKSAEETEKELIRIIPKEYWAEINRLFVMWGQNLCTPRSPHCSKCPLAYICKKNNVFLSR